MKPREDANEIFDWTKMPGWATSMQQESLYGSDLDESLFLTEDKYTDIEIGTCFKLAAKPAVYEIVRLDEATGEINFQSYKHPYGYWWKTTYNYLKHLVDIGDFEILSQSQLDALKEY